LTDCKTYDRAKSQVHNQGDRQATFGYLADQGAGRAGVWSAAFNHEKAHRHACRCPGTAAGENWEARSIDDQTLGYLLFRPLWAAMEDVAL